MRVFAHLPHRYEDRATHQVYEIAGGAWREVPDAVGEFLLRAHPAKLCDVTNEAEPDAHQCAKGEYRVEALLTPPADTMLKPHLSRQRREKLRATQKRSRVARMMTRGA